MIFSLKRNQHRNIYFVVFFTVAVFLLTSYTVFNYVQTLKKNFQQQVEITLREVSEQNAKLLQAKINENMNFLIHIADEIGPKLESNLNNSLKYLEKATKLQKFDNIGIIYAYGTAYTTNGLMLNVSDREYFKLSMAGQNVITNPLTERFHGKKVIVFSLPVYIKDKVSAVLFATYSTSQMDEIFSNYSFDRRAYSYVARKNGNVIVDSDYKNKTVPLENLFDSLRTVDNGNKKMAEELQKSITDGKSGCLKFKNRIYKYIYYYPAGINDWYIFIFVPINVIDNIFDLILDKTLHVSVINFGSFALLFIFILYYQIESKKKLAKIAYVDKLTGGDSFEKFCIDADYVLKQYSDSPDEKRKTAVLVLNAANFKEINDIFGMAEGDKAIRFMSQTINNITMNGELYARQSADRFYALLYFETKKDIIDRLSYVHESLKKYSILEDKKYPIEILAGISEIKEKNTDINLAIANADAALKTTEQNSEKFYAFFDATIRQSLMKKNAIEKQMFQALQDKEFTPYYLPYYNVFNKSFAGAETITNWIKQDGSIISDFDFNDLFEKNFFITTLDKYIFSKICEEIKTWTDMGIDCGHISMHLSKLNFYNPDSITEFKKIADENEVKTKKIAFEIPADATIENIHTAQDYIYKLKGLGFKIIIKDLKADGYSSFGLKNISFDMIKLNKNFLGGVKENLSSKVIKNMIHIIHLFNAKVIISGVLDEKEYEFLKSAECDIIQGSFMSAPLKSKDFEKMLVINQQNRPVKKD